MEKATRIICCVFILGMFLFTGGPVKAFPLHAELNTVFLPQDHGYMGKLRWDPLKGKGVYLDWLQVGDYYRQLGIGLEAAWHSDSFGQIWFLLGYENYHFPAGSNGLYRLGARTDLPIEWGEIGLEVDLMMDNLVGPFFRYECEIRFPKTWVQSQIGFGNLFGSRDGFAVWVGFDL